jgi:hypothetical protein
MAASSHREAAVGKGVGLHYTSFIDLRLRFPQQIPSITSQKK